MSVSLTAAAEERLNQQIASHQAVGLRFSVKKSGCSGFSYVMDFADAINDDDQVFTTGRVKVVVDSESLSLIDGTQIDYVSEGLNQSFTFSNPRATDQCGCGESFAIQS